MDVSGQSVFVLPGVHRVQNKKCRFPLVEFLATEVAVVVV